VPIGLVVGYILCLKLTGHACLSLRQLAHTTEPVRGGSPPFLESLEKVDAADPDSSTVLVVCLSTFVHEKSTHSGTTVTVGQRVA